jgi:hypothetical protein
MAMGDPCLSWIGTGHGDQIMGYESENEK